MQRVRRFLGSRLFVLMLGTASVLSAGPVSADKAPPRAVKAPPVEAKLYRKLNGEQGAEPTAKFTKDAATIYGTWRAKTKDAPEGMAYRVAWIAEDVGKAAPPNTLIIESKSVVRPNPNGKQGDESGGTFSLSRPTNGWPLGRYRADLYFADKLVKTLNFTVE